MKIYTRTGDDGGTALFGGGRVRKDHVRVAAYGTVDELKNVVYDVSETVAGLENMEMVLTRGKAITFNTYQ